MMAQDFQDITGQIIKKVVTITQKLEQELAQLLIDNAPQSTREREKEKVVDLLAGPDVPTSAMAQTDVDDLLADLGF
jgi:chemotaxis protein CheZ